VRQPRLLGFGAPLSPRNTASRQHSIYRGNQGTSNALHELLRWCNHLKHSVTSAEMNSHRAASRRAGDVRLAPAIDVDSR